MAALWLRLPFWLVPLAVVSWILKDLLLYRFVSIAYEGSKPSGPESMVGAVGTATEDLSPKGWVKIGPELWHCESVMPVRARDTVRVTGCDGMMLKVEPVPPKSLRTPDQPDGIGFRERPIAEQSPAECGLRDPPLLGVLHTPEQAVQNQ